MKLEEIFNEWMIDAEITEEGLADDAMDQAKLHAKWYRELSAAKLNLVKIQQEYDALYKIKHAYFAGYISKEELDNRGWTPNRLKILNKDLDMHIKNDPDVTEININKALAKEKVDVLDSIVRMIMNRNFAIKTALDAIKFRSGEF